MSKVHVVHVVCMVCMACIGVHAMDGIDGIAGIEAFTVCLGGGALWWWANGSPLALFPFALAAASLGFLLWNFPKAKIFMGDGGSGFLGFILGLLIFIFKKIF